MIYAEDLDFTVSREGSCTGTGFCRQSMQKKNTQYSCYGYTDHGKETGADLLLSAFEILIKYVKKNKQINGFNIKIVKERIEGGANEKAVWRLFINCPFVCINFDFFWLNKARQLYMDF